MGAPEKVAKNLRAFKTALDEHDAVNPEHNAYGIGLSHFDIERLGFEQGEEIFPGIRIECDGKTSGNFRVLCDGDHDGDGETDSAWASRFDHITPAVGRVHVPA